MDPRPKIHKLLKSCFPCGITAHVYHQRPGKTGLVYPCIIYRLNDIPANYANNEKYIVHREYQVTVIDEDPDSKLRENVAYLRCCRFNRSYVSEGLNHFVFTLTY